MFRETPLARVWVSSRRVSMPPGGTNIEAKGGSIAYAGFVWDHRHTGKNHRGLDMNANSGTREYSFERSILQKCMNRQKMHFR
jgi:hypothetical protein